MAKRILSFDLRANFACFKKPDVNDGIILTFNCLHKPALLGILGAIIGLKGYNKKENFQNIIKHLKICPLELNHLKDFTKKEILVKQLLNTPTQLVMRILMGH
ncbi:CRISPR-associated protein Cas5 [Pseudarcicella hirudinis]|uniref:CRISPR-associated protein Cas5 n=1 Tax=Pseudarcicella hirudinis TaxID=1079859 RepID=UPI0035F0E095